MSALKLPESSEQKAKVLACEGMTARLCRVSCRDATGAEHSVEISANSLYEAVGRGLHILRADDWIGGVGALTVAVRNPEVTHSVRIADFENWLRGSGKSPAEESLKHKLRLLLPDGKSERS
jgi:hypothetical protein